MEKGGREGGRKREGGSEGGREGVREGGEASHVSIAALIYLAKDLSDFW